MSLKMGEGAVYKVKKWSSQLNLNLQFKQISKKPEKNKFRASGIFEPYDQFTLRNMIQSLSYAHISLYKEIIFSL